MRSFRILVLGITVALTAAQVMGQKNKKPGGGGGPPGTDMGQACMTLMDNLGDAIQSDGRGIYCHSADGQVTVGDNKDAGIDGTQRFAWFGGKFNGNERVVTIDCNGCTPYTGGAVFQSWNASFLGLGPGSWTKVRLAIKYAVTKRERYTLGYGVDFNGLGVCPGVKGEPDTAEEAKATCEAHDSTSCTAWTITGTTACLMNQRTGEVLESLVEAPFEMYVCLQGTAGCPAP